METAKQEKEVPHFTGWKNVPDGYYTKTTLNREYGVKPIDLEEPDATLRAFGGGRWKDFMLYHIDNTKPVKRRKVKLLECTKRNLGESLYIINKSAKKSRDTKKVAYYSKQFQIVNASKTRQNKLYDLKAMVIQKLLDEDKATVLGYHEQQAYNGDINYLKLLEVGGYTFHLPITKYEANGLKRLGEINIISAEPTRKTSINFYEAEKLLLHYIKNNE